MKTNKFQPGDKVRNQYGYILTVVYQKNDCQVFVKEESNSWYHQAKLFKIKQSKKCGI